VEAFAAAGIHLQTHTLKIILPVGVSFYTFQALSYSIDIYRKKIEPTRDIIAFFAFVSFFPQLVAGPIERATNLLPQFYARRNFDYAKAVDGMRQILWGLFKKIVIADNCAVYVNQVFDTPQTQSSSTLLLAAIFFAFQIYGDFSGYSDIAIGTARLFGFNLMRNFNFPYFSRDIAEFWRRWHISLTTWFRDYIYIPLGGNRVSKAKVIRNTFIIFLVSGFWHGANWTFIVWGGFHALLFLPLVLLGKNRKNTNTIAENRIFPTITECFQWGITFLLVIAGWVFFRAKTIGEAVVYLAGICNTSFFEIPTGKKLIIRCFLFILLLLIMEWLNRNKQHGLEQMDKVKPIFRYVFYYMIVLAILLFAGKEQVFIYFQF
jgi:D-alanyl-lipoteichoic acid acyltransferase DltB (MBOAT superfamily)